MIETAKKEEKAKSEKIKTGSSQQMSAVPDTDPEGEKERK